MPIYEYQCPQCHNIFEEWLSVSTATDTSPCPECNTSAARIISNTAFVLKGGGWYVTEYGNRKQSNNGACSAGNASSASGEVASAPATPTPSTSSTPSTSTGAAAGA